MWLPDIYMLDHTSNGTYIDVGVVSHVRFHPMTAIDRQRAIGAACAHDLNDELTIIMNATQEARLRCTLDYHTMWLLNRIQDAADRCTWKTTGLLTQSLRGKVTPSPASMERIILMDSEDV